MPYRLLPHGTREEAVRLYAGGLPSEAVARMLGVGACFVEYWAGKAGIMRSRKEAAAIRALKFPRIDGAAAYGELAAGRSQAEAAAALGVYRRKVQRAVSEHAARTGLPVPSPRKPPGRKKTMATQRCRKSPAVQVNVTRAELEAFGLRL